MPDFSVFSSAVSSFFLVSSMMVIGLIIFAPNVAKYGVDKIESLFGISFKEGFSRLERQNQERLGRSMARDVAREYYKNNKNRLNRSVPYKGKRN